MAVTCIKIILLSSLLIKSNYQFSQDLPVNQYFHSVNKLEEAETLIDQGRSKKAKRILEKIEKIPLDYQSKFYRLKSFVFFNIGEIDSSYYYALKSKNANLFEYYSNYFLKAFDSIPEYEQKIKSKFKEIDSLKKVKFRNIDSTIQFLCNNDQSIERIMLGRGNYNSKSEKDSLEKIMILKDDYNKLLLDSLISEFGWISKISSSISFQKWDIIVIHGDQSYIMKYVQKGYDFSLKNKADWKNTISLMSWALAPHRKKNKEKYDLLPKLDISVENENYQNFLAYSFYEVLNNFKEIGNEKGNSLILSVPKNQYKIFKKIYRKSISFGLKPEQLMLEINNSKSSLYKYELIE